MAEEEEEARPQSSSSAQPPPASPARSSSGNAKMQKGGPAASAPAADWKHQFKAKMQGKIGKMIKEGTGPSFDERLMAAAARKRKDALETEKQQKQIIADAVARARERPSWCPHRTAEETPESIESRAKKGVLLVRERDKEAAQKLEELKHRMKTREPLFKVSEVNAGYEEMRQRQEARKRQLAKEEKEQWAHLREIQEKVFERPLLLEDGGQKDPKARERKPIEERLVPNHSRPTTMDLRIQNAFKSKGYLESQWAGEVKAIREKTANRVPLSDIPYPPKKYPPPPPRPKDTNDTDKRMAKVVSSPWFLKCDWAQQVKEIRQRQHDRPKLHEITYPPKKAGLYD